MEERIKPDIPEAMRYLGAEGAEELGLEVSAVGEELSARVQPRWTWKVFALVREGERFFLPAAPLILEGDTAGKMLSECREAVLLLCTLGAPFETLFRAVQARDMARAVMLDACGSALVEAGCRRAEGEIAARFPGRFLTDRFSPGYGDLPLALQRGVCDALDGGKRLGVQVTESCLMNPAKSVTAVIGLADRPQMARVRGCGYCALRERCAIRKGGKRCGTV